MNKNRLIWLLCAILTFIVFYFCIPTSVADISPLAIAFIGALLLTTFSIQTLGDFKSWKEFNNTPKLDQDWRHRSTPFLVIPGLVMVFVFVLHYSSDQKSELKKYGVKTIGTIVDGSSLTSHRGGKYDLVVEFTTKEGKHMRVSENVGENEFKQVGKGQQIEMLYSEKDPTIIELFITDLTRKEYEFEGAEKDIQVKDLFTFIGMENEKLGKMLNGMNFKWVYNASDSIWYNDVRHLAIKTTSTNKIIFSSFDLHDDGAEINDNTIFSKYKDQFKALQFSETKNDSLIFYRKDNFSAQIKNILKNIGVGFQVGQEIQIEKE